LTCYEINDVKELKANFS